jgi:AAA family ATP:ADP antiporter
MSYALNNPCKELLYQPTASSVKFKCKSWIDTFGARGSKALGSVVTNAYANSLDQYVENTHSKSCTSSILNRRLLGYGTLVSVSVCAFLIYVATYMGKKFSEYNAAGIKVGENNAVGDILFCCSLSR